MKSILFFPLLIPFVTSVASLLSWNRRRLQRLISACGAGALFVAAILLLVTVWRDGILVMQIGNWPAPFGITLVADLFSAMMVAIAGLMGITVVIYSLDSADIEHEAFGYHPLLHILLLGVCGSFVTGDLFNLYVWFEVMLIASFVLLALGGQRKQMEGAIKYVALNLLASTLFLSAIGMLYGVAGTLNMADLARYLHSAPNTGLMTVLAMLFLMAFGIKSAIFPMFFWLPASYHTAPAEVSAIFAGLLTKVGVYSLIRIFTLLFVQDIGFTHGLILLLSGLTMVSGVLGAVAQNEFRRVLSFHIISQVGYMLLGLGLFTTAALAGSVFYIIHHIIVKTNLFLVSGVVRKLRGTLELGHLGGLYHSAPVLALLFLIPALSLAGLPPLSGFWAKLTLVREALVVENYLIVVIALLVGLLTMLSMTKIWGKAFWGEPPEADTRDIKLSSFSRLSLYLPMIILALLTIGIGLLAEPLYAMSLRAAEQLLNPAGYVYAVLGRIP
jgi:multicomponent Na+:H+ antiporter subunit D